MKHEAKIIQVVDPLVNADVLAMELGQSRTTIWRWWARDGYLPKPVKLGKQAAGWPRSVIDAWKVEQGWPSPDSAEATAEGGAQ